MKYVFSINGGFADNIANINDDDSIFVADAMPAYEPHENCHAHLMYDEEHGIHWVYTPYTNSEMREIAYETEKLIVWGEELLTVDEANKLWQVYEAEGSEKAETLTVLIAEAKKQIRERYPD